MKIRNIKIDSFGPYRDWQFSAAPSGVQLIYGPNESGKTSLLEGLRTLLFGGKHKKYGYFEGSAELEKEGTVYYLGRHQKQLHFYTPGEPPIGEEPNQVWWHGLDKKTYNRIFALTLEDLQGIDILQEVDVRARFFGAEGGEQLGSAVKGVEKNITDLLVASSTGKRRINVLLDQLADNKQRLANLANYEVQYVELQQAHINSEQTEMEIQHQIREWQEYRDGVDMVLRAWDTYRRSEEAKQYMHRFMPDESIDKEAFWRIDEGLKEAQYYMQVWNDKEEALKPSNFDPQGPFAIYGQDVEELMQQSAKWEQLRRECEEGAAYIQKVKEQLTFSRSLHSAWHTECALDDDINWFEGERLSKRLRSAREQLQYWAERNSAYTDTGADSAVANVITGDSMEITQPSMAAISSTEEVTTRTPFNEWLELEIRTVLADMEELRLTINDRGTTSVLPVWLQRIGGIGAIIGVLMALAGLVVFEAPQYTIVGTILLILGVILFWYAWRLRHLASADESKWRELERLEKRHEQLLSKLEREQELSDGQLNFEAAAVEKAYREEGKILQANYDMALAEWQAWLPQGAVKSLNDDDFFSMKQEYDQYHEQLRTIEGYDKRLAEHREALNLIEEQASTLWYNLEIDTPVTPTELKRIYNQYKNFQQQMMRWEQKESQRKAYRVEYDNWHRKEKALLLEQKALLEKAGIAGANEYRQRLIDENQYKQWETIYKQSQVQLDLLTPPGEHKDLFYRRLSEGNKEHWLEEQIHSDEEIAKLQESLANVYEKRGQIVEAMRSLGSDGAQREALQERSGLERELESALEDWATQVVIARCMDEAQQSYEEEAQPKMLTLASNYINRLTNGAYTLDMWGLEEGLALLDKDGKRLDLSYWSSGLGDQVYLALRLALAKVFSYQVDALPIILDDIFVRFDEKRQQSALQLLAELGQEQQIWIFTCQQQVYNMAEAIDGIDRHMLERL